MQKEVRIEDWIDDLGEEIQSRLGITGGDQASHSTSYSAVMCLCAASDRCENHCCIFLQDEHKYNWECICIGILCLASCTLSGTASQAGKSVVWVKTPRESTLCAGYFENFRLRVPKEPRERDGDLGKELFPETRGMPSTQWSGASSGEIQVLTGGLWDDKSTELLVQPLMYGKFMEYGHNGALPSSVPISFPAPMQHCSGTEHCW